MLIDTVINQTKRPILWVIINSGTDNSVQECQKLLSYYDWIHLVRQNKFYDAGYSHRNFAQGINEAYSAAKRLASDKGFRYEYIGKIDATTRLIPSYFEILMQEISKDDSLAFVCGTQRLLINGKYIDILPSKDGLISALNDIRLYRRDFFERIGGYPISYSPDTVLLIKALNRKLRVKVVDNVYFVKTRLGGTKIGFWDGYKLKGKSMYWLGYHPFLAMLNSLYISYKFPPHFAFIPMMQGYISSLIRGEPQSEDMEVIEYFQKRRLSEVLRIKMRSMGGGKYRV